MGVGWTPESGAGWFRRFINELLVAAYSKPEMGLTLNLY